MWTIYDHPTDYPSFFVARRWKVDQNGAITNTGDVVTATGINKLRSVLRNLGLTRVERDPSDDPKIIETWL